MIKHVHSIFTVTALNKKYLIMSFCISMTWYRPVGTRGAQYIFSTSALRLVQYWHRTLFHVVFSTHQYNNTNNHRDIQCLIHHYWNILRPLQFKTDIRSFWKGCDHTVALDTAARRLASLWQAGCHIFLFGWDKIAPLEKLLFSDAAGYAKHKVYF